ncbi:homoserine kinase type II [Frondihabitans sucicola]|uniref:Homoserine kinase type II n=1 Tax=Frondihabitans sucicola TaxID=1268041 RepID=A0ABM8GSF9_9MICO|nr:phosphotransferase [Frondihabitans sucicola]BDZ51350.1 homoserine kinase type II [Frondihabitans sucicola]
MFPSGVSMLWESIDATEAFRSRFGFTGFDQGSSWLTSTLRDRWALTVLHCERIVISDQNAIAWVEVEEGGQTLICKWSGAEARFAKLAATTDLISALAERGVPVAAPILSRSGQGREVIAGPSRPFSVSVQPVVEGAPLDVADDAAVRRAGAHLARLHQAMAELPTASAELAHRAPHVDLRTRVLDWMAGSSRPPDSDGRLLRDLSALPALDVGPQAVHNDYRSANLVTRDSQVVAILDFDEVAWDHPVSDLAHAGVYLGTLFREWGPTSAAARQILLEGYESVRALTGPEREWFGFLTSWYSILAGWPLVGEQDR